MIFPLPAPTTLPEHAEVHYAIYREEGATPRPIDRVTALRLCEPTGGLAAVGSEARLVIDPARHMAALRAAIAEALPVDPVAEAEFEAWMRTHEAPAKKRALTRRGRMTPDG